MIEIPRNSVIILDLDDTLYAERDFERSGLLAILHTLDVSTDFQIEELVALSQQGEDIFAYLGFDDLLRSVALTIYRQHMPTLRMYPDAKDFIDRAQQANCTLAIATEGRSTTQRNKIIALGLQDVIDLIFISDEIGYRKIQSEFFNELASIVGDRPCFMFGDNPIKDFVIPNSKGWLTCMLEDRGNNVHSQSVTVEKSHIASEKIQSFAEVTFVN